MSTRFLILRASKILRFELPVWLFGLEGPKRPLSVIAAAAASFLSARCWLPSHVCALPFPNEISSSISGLSTAAAAGAVLSSLKYPGRLPDALRFFGAVCGVAGAPFAGAFSAWLTGAPDSLLLVLAWLPFFRGAGSRKTFQIASAPGGHSARSSAKTRIFVSPR